LRSPHLTLLDYLVWYILQELVYEGKREPFANFKDLQNVIGGKWHAVDIRYSESEKVMLQWKWHLTAMAKQNNGAMQHIFRWSVDWWLGLLWRADIVWIWVATATQMMSHLQNLLCDVQHFFCLYLGWYGSVLSKNF